MSQTFCLIPFLYPVLYSSLSTTKNFLIILFCSGMNLVDYEYFNNNRAANSFVQISMHKLMWYEEID